MSLSARISRTVPRSVRQERPGDSKAHLAMIRRLPCCLPGCGSHGDAHHLLNVHDGAPKGVGRKNEDRWTVSVCRAHHDAAHAAGNDEAWFAGQGVQVRDLAMALWRNRDNEEACHRLVDRVKQQQWVKR
jgi:hypothetical protein